ncbi:MAG: N-acetylmuramoyl-L-alanine amidase, partial [Thermoanaerobaculia bacterium]|nr:N-acetylmuramoyl-L-alanine amidase [Thermoanaerobaculia bacterium]
DNFREIRRVNRLFDDHLEPGQSVLIPARLLRPGLRSALPVSSRFYLEYGEDGRGEYAIYRLKPGEALYSSVVVRFTGNVFADDVNALAGEIAGRSGIRDVTDIPVGFAVKVPFSLLLPEFLPAGHPRRREYEEGVLDSSRFGNRVRADRLRGVTVVLDSGHGGADVGASLGGVWESLYVYDIMLRVKRLLETTTSAAVVPTIQDGRGFDVPERDVLPYSRGHRVLTDPAYPIADSKVGLHLRWYLANSVFRRAVARGGEPERVVFLSVHADSLHPSLRGAMVYIPGALYRKGSFGKSGAVYASRREVREEPRVSFSSRELARSEGLSRELAARVLDAFAAGGLEVHREKPIREKVIRQRRAWVPAVLRFNAVPAAVLVEVCNLANTEDRKLLQTRAFRERVAQALVDGLVSYYDVEAGSPGVRVARTAR